MLVSGPITVEGVNDAAKRANERNKGGAFKNYVSFNVWISNVNNNQIDNAKDVDVVMPINQEQNRYFDYLTDPSFQGVNILFVSSFINRINRTVHTGYYIPKVEIKGFNVINDGRNLSNQPIKNDLKQMIKKRKIAIATGHGDYYTAGCLVDYPYFKEHRKLIAIDLS